MDAVKMLIKGGLKKSEEFVSVSCTQWNSRVDFSDQRLPTVNGWSLHCECAALRNNILAS